jgi:hypothetical protein
MSELIESLLKCTVSENIVLLPKEPLENYAAVRTALIKAGGKYKKNTFVFPNDAQPYINRLTSGESVNIKKEFQFYETPEAVIEKMKKHIDLTLPEHKDNPIYYLEPSAGQGALLDVLTEQKYQILTIHYFEKMEINQSILEKKYLNTEHENVHFLGEDFLKIDKKYSNFYNLVFANPPFSKNQDIKHLKKMYEVCSNEGTIVCVMSVGWMYNSGKIYDEFRKWIGFTPHMSESQIRAFGNEGGSIVLSRHNDFEIDEQVLVEMVNTGEFKKSGTNVPTCIVVIHKN